MRAILSFILLLAILFSGCTDTSPSVDSTAQSTALNTGFCVDGTVLRDANGIPFLMRGVNHMYTWYPEETPDALCAISDAGCNCVRIVLADGTRWPQNTADEVAQIIRTCKENRLIAILEVHDTTGSNALSGLNTAAQYFIDIKDVLIGQEAHVILNIANEWPTAVDTPTWKSGYLQILPLLRQAGLNHAVMIDCNGGGQSGRCMQRAGAEILDADPLHNVFFSLHVYESVATSEKIEKNLRYATDQGLCVCVGEFGYLHNDTSIDVDFLLSYCREQQIGYLAWCWKGNASPNEHLDLSQDWANPELTPDWGVRVVDGKDGISQTAEICSVFTDNS